MNLMELIEEVKKVVAEIDNEEVDYKKIKSLMAVLKKLIVKFREKALLSSLTELTDVTYVLMSEWMEDKSSNLGQVLRYMFEIAVEAQRNDYIDFGVSPVLK